MDDQIPRSQRDAELAWIRREMEEARVNALAPIPDYATASYWQLEARYDATGDPAAKAEMDRRAAS